MKFLAAIGDVIARALATWRPPPKRTLSEWANAEFYLSPESSAQAGRWTCLPYQREPMDAITDPRVTFVTWMKSARIGYTKIIDAAIGYGIDQDPCSQMVVQPTVDDAKGYSKEEIAPMLRDCPRLAKIVFEDSEEEGPKGSGNTILHKRYPGGVLSLVGANSGTGLRRVSRKRVFLDEVDAYPPSAGSDGDPVKLATKRTDFYWDRKIVAGSTPLLKGSSRIEQMFLLGDQRRYYVPCPHCGHFDYLVFTERDSGGHWMEWPKDKPEEAHFICSGCGCAIGHEHKRDMVAAGEWRAAKPFTDHASFHLWAAYSYSPNATWGQLAAEFLEAKRGGREQLKTFINNVLGETWQESGDAPDWERLYQRREHYPKASVPAGVKFLTVGVDVQKDRFVYEVVGWGPGKESWSVDAGVIPGDTAKAESWALVTELLGREYPGASGLKLTAKMLAIDSGYNTQSVYNWARHHVGRVIAVKGVHTARTLIGTPTPVDVMFNGARITRGCKVWPVGSDIAKDEIYACLSLQPPTVESKIPHPPGFCHFPEHGEDYFKQLTGEHKVPILKERTRFTVYEWQKIPGRENHYLDCRVYARAAAAVMGIDRWEPKVPPVASASNVAPAQTLPEHRPAAPKPPKAIRSDSRFTLRSKSGKPWLGR